MATSSLSAAARRLGSVLEPVVGQVYFSPECHTNYAALGFDPSARSANTSPFRTDPRTSPAEGR